MKEMPARRLMKNLRTGKMSGYDPRVVATGQWVEVLPEPKKPKGLIIRRLSVGGSLDVKANDGNDSRHH